MSVKSLIQDGLGTDRLASVTAQNALLVQVVPQTSKGVPPEDLSNLRLLREFFVDSTGSSSHRVNGSVTPVEFAVRASQTSTKWLTGFRIIIEADGFEIATADFRDYGATLSPGLANGIQIEAIQSGITTSIASLPIKTAGDYLIYADSFTNFVNAISAQSDYFEVRFSFDVPIVLTKGSTDQLVIRIRDNLVTALLSAATPRQFAIVQGYQESV